MLTAGIILLAIYYIVLPIPPLFYVGWILLIIGLVLLLFSVVGRPLGPRRWYY